MKKEIIKPFDLEKAKAGAKLRTRGGLPVEIFKWDARGSSYPIRGIVIAEKEDKSEIWALDGSYDYNHCPDTFDLVIVEEVEEVEEPEFWSDNKNNTFGGFFINFCSDIEELVKVSNTETNHNVFATEKQAKSALAMARISQIMANDIKNFGGVITDEEWKNDKGKAIIYRNGSRICKTGIINDYYFLAFHTEKQRDLFLEKYPQLVKDYLMINE
jgi:hypothetical protein